MTPDQVLSLVEIWISRGWLRPLDQAFVRFLRAQAPEADGTALLAAALVSHQLGRGHICLDLKNVLADPDASLALPPDGDPGEWPSARPSRALAGVGLDAWQADLLESPLVTDRDGAATPLVLHQGRLYLRRYWRCTSLVARELTARLTRHFPVPSDLPQRLDRLFRDLRSTDEKEKTEVHWQSVAAALAARNAVTIISGGPGTGKTTAVVQILALLQEMALETGKPLKMLLAAPTGKAAARLTESMGTEAGRLQDHLLPHIPGEVSTLHRLLGSRRDSRRFIHNRENRLHADLVVVDEASMVDLEMMAALVDALPDRARLILLGDKDQLASVEAGAVLGDLCRNAGNPCYTPETVAWVHENTGYGLGCFEGPGNALDQQIVVLRKSHRFDDTSGIGSLARCVNTGNPDLADAVWDQSFPDIRRIEISTTDDPAFRHLVLDGGPGPGISGREHPGPSGYRAYLDRLNRGPEKDEPMNDWLGAILDLFGRFQLLSALRKGDWGVQGLNEKAAAILHRAGLIPSMDGWYPGRPVMVTQNDYSLGLMNGDVGITVAMAGSTLKSQALRVVFAMADGSLKTILPSRLTRVETMYAMTVHKAQGSEFQHTALVLPDRGGPVLTRELVYTGITRARNWLTLVTPRPDVMGDAIETQTLRASGLGDLFTG